MNTISSSTLRLLKTRKLYYDIEEQMIIEKCELLDRNITKLNVMNLCMSYMDVEIFSKETTNEVLNKMFNHLIFVLNHYVIQENISARTLGHKDRMDEYQLEKYIDFINKIIEVIECLIRRIN